MTNAESARSDRIKPEASLNRLALSAAKLEILTYGGGMVLRFVSSLVLSRLLFPEAFGLAVTIGLVSMGLVMLSNVGVAQSIVQSPNGEKIEFLNTGWTLLIVRGAALWLLSVLLAKPVALVLNEPELSVLLPVGCLGVLISGLASTSLITLRRKLQVRPLLAIEVGAQVLTFVANIAFALWLQSVWSLVIGSLVGSLFSTVASHFLNVGYKNRLAWHAASWREIYEYGRWIQASSALSFVSGQADRFLLAHFIGMASLGVYNFAAMLADAISSAVVRLTHGVLFPLFSQIGREDSAHLADRYYRIRLRSDLLTLLPLGVIAASSQGIVDVLFDARYAEAGWMLQALCLRAGMTCMLAPVETYLFAVGQTRYGFYRDLARAFWVLSGIPIAWNYGGLSAVIWVVALSEVPVTVVLWTGFARLGSMRWARELVGPVVFLVGFAAAHLLAQIILR